MCTLATGYLRHLALIALLTAMLPVLSGCTRGYETVRVDDLTRRYLLHVPPGISGDKPVPLVLALHQFLDTPTGMRSMTGLNALADREGFLVVYPKGRWRRWEADSDPCGRDHRFLDVLIDHLASRHPVDPSRIYATGASAGAFMIQAYARHTDRLAAIAPVMGTLSRNLASDDAVPPPLAVLLIHGIEDPVIPYAGGAAGGPHARVFLSAEDTAAYWAAAVGCGIEPEVTTTPVGDSDTVFVRRFAYACPEGAEVMLLAVGGCGHSWPGHQSRFPRFLVGPSVAEPDATEQIWDFFVRLRMPAYPGMD